MPNSNLYHSNEHYYINKATISSPVTGVISGNTGTQCEDHHLTPVLLNMFMEIPVQCEYHFLTPVVLNMLIEILVQCEYHFLTPVVLNMVMEILVLV